MRDPKTLMSAAAAAAILAIFASSVSGQFEVLVKRKNITQAAKNTSSSGPRTRPRPIVASVRRVTPTVVRETRTVRVSSLSVTTEPGALVTLATKGPQPAKRDLSAGGDGIAIFDDVRPGTYVVTSKKDGFESAEADPITIIAQRAQGLDLDLKPITYKLKIKTNVSGGEIKFAPAIETGKDAAGNILSRPLGNYCVVAIRPNGEAEITDLKRGYYDIDIIPTALEYEVTGAGINLPEDLDQDNGSTASLKTFEIDLEKKISTEEFSTVWAPTDWVVPKGWSLERGLRVRGDGIAFPRNERYLYYTAFDLVANIKLNDKGGAAFVLRADDPRNYYLLEIGGPNAPWGEIARLSVVKNGVPTVLNSASTVPFRSTLTSDSGFQVKVRSNPTSQPGFNVWVEDSNTGRENAIGDFRDQNNTYQKGAAGIAGFQRADFDVRFFRVCPGRCP